MKESAKKYIWLTFKRKEVINWNDANKIEERKEIAWKEYEKIRDLSYKKYNKIIKLAYEKYQKILEEIDNEPEEIPEIIKKIDEVLK